MLFYFASRKLTENKINLQETVLVVYVLLELVLHTTVLPRWAEVPEWPFVRYIKLSHKLMNTGTQTLIPCCTL